MSETRSPEVRMTETWSSRNPMIDRPEFYNERKSLGWVPMIFGENGKGGYTMIVSALLEIENSWSDTRPDQLYGTKEEAQEAWDNAAPSQITNDVIGRCHITADTLDVILDQGLYRSTALAEKPTEEEWDF